MALRHSLPPVALGAVALGAALAANPAHADTPSPRPLPLLEVATSPKAVTVSVSDVVEVRLTVPLPLPTAVVPLPLPLPVPLPSTDPLPLPSEVPLPTPSANPTTVPSSRPTRPPSPRATTAPSASASRAARVAPRPSPAPSTPAPATVSPGGTRGAAPEQAHTTSTARTGERPTPPARPASGPPAFVLALASTPTGFGAGGADPPTSTAEAVLPSTALHPGRTVTAVDMRATSRPVERGPPPPRRLLITHSRPRR